MDILCKQTKYYSIAEIRGLIIINYYYNYFARLNQADFEQNISIF